MNERKYIFSARAENSYYFVAAGNARAKTFVGQSNLHRTAVVRSRTRSHTYERVHAHERTLERASL